MSATYNWSITTGSPIGSVYLTGSVNPILVAAAADNVRPSNAVYVALFGNDITGNGSRMYPYKTIKKAISIQTNIVVIGSGVYREYFDTGGNYSYYIGDGDVIIDSTGNVGGFGNNLMSGYFYNITIRNAKAMPGDIRFEGCKFSDCGFEGPAPLIHNKCIIERATSPLRVALTTSFNNTYVDCWNLRWIDQPNNQWAKWLDIFYNCNIWFDAPSFLSHSVLHHCNVFFGSSQPSVPTLPPTTVPTGYTQVNTIDDLRNAHIAAFPSGIAFNFPNCITGDPLFNNYNVGDYTLQFSSPAKNLSYFGTYVGARSIAQSLKVRAMESAGDFEFSSAINLTVADDSLTLTSTAADARIDTNVIVNLLGRELASFPAYGFNADRNGQYIDSIPDLDTVAKGAGSTLNVPAPYLVENGAIVYNGNTYTAGVRFTTVAGQTSFTTATGGVVREIIEAPQRHTVMARFSDGGAAITSGTALTTGYYYYVQTGSVTYNSVVYSSGDTFKAVDTNAFSGSGTAIVAFSTESFQHYEPGVKPTSNNVGDSRAGAIIRGNGDPTYVRGGLGIQEFPINAKFIQVRYYIRVNNLKP